jgi:hypothetical protein
MSQAAVPARIFGECRKGQAAVLEGGIPFFYEDGKRNRVL